MTSLQPMRGAMRLPSARRGFTFLEIMFVVVIIGVLLAIAVPRLTGRSRMAQIRATEATMRNIGVALAEYEIHLGGFPTTNDGLQALLEPPRGADENAWEGPYLDKMPRDPWGNEFNYRFPGDHNRDYDLWSNGPDRQEGTDDDIVNWERD